MIKRGIILLVSLIILTSFVSADIILNQQPKNIYNLGDTIKIPLTIKSVTDTSGTLNADLLCNGHTLNFYKNGVSLESGEEVKLSPALVLTKNIIGELKGTCKIKISLNEEYLLTNTFEISNIIEISINLENSDLKPGENIFIQGSALKNNGQDVNGYIDARIESGNTTKIAQIETINNGFFEINTSVPEDMAAGIYSLKLTAYEEDPSEEITNKGILTENIRIKQVPTSLEIVFDNQKVEPGTNLKVKSILYDQTGEKINATSFLTIKNNNNKIMEQQEISTDEFIEYPIKYNEAPMAWKIVSVSNKLNTESEFKIKEKESVDIDIINKTVTITNTGNIPYNNTVFIKIGNESLNIQVYLEVDKEEKYLLKAPDGIYTVNIIAGNETASVSDIALTGKTIDIKKASSNVGTLMRYPIVWIFLIILLGFIGFMILKRGHKRTFFGYISSKIPRHKKTHSEKDKIVSSQDSKKNFKPGKAILSLSIKGDKQSASLVSIHIKNLHKLESEKGNAKETIQKIISIATQNKAVYYKSRSHLFFIMAPAKTKTFSNEKPALNLAQKIKSELDEHNKKFKQKIDYGISLTHGNIVAKQDKEGFKFMSLGNLMGNSKKLSTTSHEKILLDNKINNKLKTHLKTEKHKEKEIEYYSIKSTKNAKDNEKFIKSFLERIEKKD